MTEKSTTVRVIQTLAPPLSRVSPELSARCLEQLFLTPRKHPRPKREHEWLATAERGSIRFDDRRHVPIFAWGRRSLHGGPVLLVHGWAGRGAQMAAFARPLVEAGHRVVTFDAPGHGDADGRLTGLPELAEAVERVVQVIGEPRAIIAHSLGTTAVTIAMARGLAPEKVVYVAPPAHPDEYLHRAAAFLGFAPKVGRRAQRRIEARFGYPFSDAKVTALAETLDAKLLIIHDEDDDDVPIAEGRTLAARWPGATLVETAGLGHRRIVRDPQVVEAAVDFLSEVAN